MSKRVKVSDLEITERELPILIYREPRELPYWSTEEQKAPVLHICKRDGEKQKRSAFSCAHMYRVTECNRVMDFPGLYMRGILDLGEYRLCPRCGTQADFECILKEYHEWLMVRDRRRSEKIQAKERRLKQEAEELATRLLNFADSAQLLGETVSFVGNPVYAIHVTHRGRVYKITEMLFT